MPIIKRCRNCKTKLPIGEEVCPACGQNLAVGIGKPEQSQVKRHFEPKPEIPVPKKEDTSSDSTDEKIRQLVKLIMRSKHLPPNQSYGDNLTKIVDLLGSINVPSDEKDIFNLFTELKIIRLRTNTVLTPKVDKAIINTMLTLIYEAKSRYGNCPLVLKMEKDLKDIKKKQIFNVIIGLAAIVIILFWIFK